MIIIKLKQDEAVQQKLREIMQQLEDIEQQQQQQQPSTTLTNCYMADI